MMCPDKQRYESKVDAETALAHIQIKYWQGAVRRREQRAYECPHCGGWHLTSQQRRAAA